jgi:hypothetical protein
MLMGMGRIWFVLALATVAMAQEGAGDTRASGPKLSAVSVVNAADYHSGAVAPSEIVVLYPTDAGPSRMVPWASDALHLSPYSVDTAPAHDRASCRRQSGVSFNFSRK